MLTKRPYTFKNSNGLKHQRVLSGNLINHLIETYCRSAKHNKVKVNPEQTTKRKKPIQTLGHYQILWSLMQ